MKGLFFIALFLLIPFASSLSLDLNITLKQQETFVIKLPIQIQNSISQEQVILKRINVEVPFEHGIKRFDGDYYVYGIAPSNEANYTLIIKGAEIISQGTSKIEDIEISIFTNQESTDYNVRPALFEGSSQADIIITSFLNNNLEIQSTLPGKSNIIISPGENSISFQFSNFPQGLNKLKIGTYDIFVYSNSPSSADRYERIKFLPRKIYGTYLISDRTPIKFRITNFGESLTDVSFNYNDELFTIKPAKIGIEQDGSLEIEIEPKSRDKAITDTIFFELGNETYELPVEILFTENQSQVSNSLSSSTKGYYCAELSGISCSADKVCSTDTIESLDESKCCTGLCEVKTDSSYSWLGYVIGTIVLLGLLWIIFRYYKTNKTNSSFSSKVAKAEKDLT